MDDNVVVKHTDPLCLKSGDPRNATDRLFIVFFLISVLAWLTIGYDGERYSDFMDILPKFIIDTTIHGITATIILFFFIFIQTKLKCRGTVYLTMFSIAIQIFALVILVSWLLFMILFSYEAIFSGSSLIVMIIIVCLIYQVSTFISVRESDVNILSELINKSCRAVSHSLAAVIFSVIASFLTLIQFSFTLNFLDDTLDITGHFKHETTRLDVVCVFLFGSLYTFNFISNFGFLVMGDYFANYYVTPDKQKISKVQIFRSIMIVVRNHLGTVAFLSMPILPYVCALIMSFWNDCRINKKSSKDAFVNVFSKISLTMDIVDFALIQTAMYGSNAFKSTRKMFDLRQYNFTLFFALNTISLKFIEISMVITSAMTIMISYAIGMLFMYSIMIFGHMIYQFSSPSIIFMQATFFMILMHKILIRPSMTTYVIYKMTSLQMSNASEKIIVE